MINISWFLKDGLTGTAAAPLGVWLIIMLHFLASDVSECLVFSGKSYFHNCFLLIFPYSSLSRNADSQFIILLSWLNWKGRPHRANVALLECRVFSKRWKTKAQRYNSLLATPAFFQCSVLKAIFNIWKDRVNLFCSACCDFWYHI